MKIDIDQLKAMLFLAGIDIPIFEHAGEINGSIYIKDENWKDIAEILSNCGLHISYFLSKYGQTSTLFFYSYPDPDDHKNLIKHLPYQFKA